jgi:hypothetical protein
MEIKLAFSYLKKIKFVLLIIWVGLLLCFCAVPRKHPEGLLIRDQDVPKKVAVLPAKLVPQKGDEINIQIEPGSENETFVTSLVRGVIHNQLAGKGYATQLLHLVDQYLASNEKGKDWQAMSPEELCKLLHVDGVIYLEILSAVILKAVAYDEYSVDVRMKLYGKTGKKLCDITESASKRKISIPTSPLGGLATVLEAVLDEPAKKHMRLVIYDWGWKISQFIPDSPHEKALPEVIVVETNIDRGTFASGDRIQVEVNAEKDLTCTFDLGDFKKSIPLPYMGGGIYKGAYVVKKGDMTSNQPLEIFLVKPNGIKRIWTETGGAITIDAEAPPTPKNIRGRASKQGVSISWPLPEAEDIKEFLLERGERPVGEFKIIAKTKEITYLDRAATQGHTYYYRVRSVDDSGNRSSPCRTEEVTMPFFQEAKLPQRLKGALAPGDYLVEGESLIPEGEVLNIRANSRLRFSPDAKLTAKGILTIEGSAESPTILEGDGWKGIVVGSRGRVDIVNASLRGCSPCMEAKGGNLAVKSTSVHGNGGNGVVIDEHSSFSLEKVHVTGFQKGAILKNGQGKMQESTITRNHIGVEFINGMAELANNNIYGNRENDVISSGKLVLDGNYLGTATVREAKLDGDIVVKSLLDAPYPHGRKVVLMDAGDITPEMIETRFQKQKALGIKAYQDKKFGDAHQYLASALSLREDKEIFLYLAYTQATLGEEDNAGKTLARGIEVFPYEIKLYQAYVNHLVAHGKREEALSLLEKALRMNPEDENLKFMKEYLEKKSVVRGRS